MAFNSKYAPSDMRRIFNSKTVELTPSTMFKSEGGAEIYSPYTHKDPLAFILDTATDTIKAVQQQLLTIKDVLIKELKPKLTNKKNEDAAVIIPFAEEQKLFGLFPRNHWVTLHYDPIENKATIIDSRPWYVSWFYPTSYAKKLLQEGIAEIYPEGKEKAKKLSFKTVYQGVQHNDTHCGAWTTQNILDLAANTNTSKAVSEQLSKYKSEDEFNVVNTLINGLNKVNRTKEPLLVKKPSLIQRFLALFSSSAEASPSSVKVTGSTHRIVPVLMNEATSESEGWDTLDEDCINSDSESEFVPVAEETTASGLGSDEDSINSDAESGFVPLAEETTASGNGSDEDELRTKQLSR
jgi:hypothetical protein